MKNLKMIIFISALLSMPIAAFAVGQVWLGLVFIIFYGIFGLIEFISIKKTGKSVTQHVQSLPKWKLWIVLSAMVVGWGALILHFLGIL
jgi:hypothetical protein